MILLFISLIRCNIHLYSIFIVVSDGYLNNDIEAKPTEDISDDEMSDAESATTCIAVMR